MKGQGHTQIRFSWYIPLLQLYTHTDVLKEESKWIIKERFSKDLKKKNSLIKNFGKIYFDKLLTYPLTVKDQQIRTLKKIPYRPLYFVTTNQKKISYNMSGLESRFSTLLRDNKIETIKFSVRVFPVGFGVISAYVNFATVIDPELCKHFVTKLKIGKKKSTVNQFVQYLKIELLKSLFVEKNLEEIKTVSLGPKIRVNLIDENINNQEFSTFSDTILGSENVNTNISFISNKKTNDQLAFHKKGVVFFTEKSQPKNKRSYFRNCLDFITDIVFGAETILPQIPPTITKADIENKQEKITELIFTFFLTLNHEVLTSKNVLNSLLPVSGMKKWYQKIAEIIEYPKNYLEVTQQLLSRVNELRVDCWYEIITNTLKENIPIITEKILELLLEKEHSIREVLTPKINLDDENKKIFNFLLEKLERDYSSRYGFMPDTSLSKENLGYCTLNTIEKALGVTGRNHLEFKSRIDILSQVGLLEAVAYEGPGSRKDSQQYRASPKHPYVNEFLKIKLAKESISELNLK
ncbi:MAG: hypothetical protein JXA54_10840 [Candidatus Heimdallarchaeota archaeon]|nr:hypothetical protein [Candidatus Heimdallarchaeota archaeon]